TARADPISPTTPVLTTMAHAMKRMILSSLNEDAADGRPCLTAFRLGTSQRRSYHRTQSDPTLPADIGAANFSFCFGTHPVYATERTAAATCTKQRDGGLEFSRS